MLVLSRKLNEKLVINPGTPQEIVVKIHQISGNRVKVGVVADKSVKVVREEIAYQSPR